MRHQDNQPATSAVPTRPDSNTELKQLFERYYQEIYRLCFGMLGNAADAEDATQEVFLRAHRSWPTYDPHQSNPRTWLGHIALNYCRSALRRRRIADFALGVFGRRTTQNEADDHDLRLDMGSALQVLDQRHRSVVLLRYYLDFSCAEIARMLQIREGTVHSRLFHARQRMQAALREERNRP